MARSFHHALLSAVVAMVVGGSALAQDTLLKEAVTAIRLGKNEEAKAKLRDALAADPSSEEALRMYQSLSQDEWFLLVTEKDGDIRKIAESIFERARVERPRRQRDPEAIAKLVQIATAHDSDFGARQDAINQLVEKFGEFSVPALVAKLRDADDVEGQIKAIYALRELDGDAVLPLLAVTESGDELLVQNAVAALRHIGDMRAAPTMAHLSKDNRIAVSVIARKFCEENGVEGDEVDLYLDQARDYLANGVPASERSEVVWSLRDGRLVATDVPPVIYPTELAKACAAQAVELAPQNLDAIGLVAQANLKEATLIDNALANNDESVQGLENVAAELRIAAYAAGSKALNQAVDANYKEGSVRIVEAAIKALESGQNPEELTEGALLRALDSGDKRIAYAAAAALVRASEGGKLPAAGKVVDVLSQAVTEEAVRRIEVISPDDATRQAVAAANSVRGLAVDASATAVHGMQEVLLDPSLDVVVINEILPDRTPEDIIGLMKRDSRMREIKIIILARDVDSAADRFGDSVDGIVQAPLTGEALVAEVNKVLEGVADEDGDRAESYAARASNALLAVAARAGDVSAAIANLELQLDRGDAVSVPAARTLGFAGGLDQLDPLAHALRTGSEGVQVASAEALGRILARADHCPKASFDALMEAVQSGGSVELRTAAAMALGRAHLSPAQKVEVQKKLRRIAGSSNDS